jgi:protein-tyrosine phosphatase
VACNPLPVDERVLVLEGGCNFRDIGGYSTSDGRRVKWRQVFRTGVLSYVTESDRQLLQQLGIQTICDLRRAEERDKEPTCWPDSTTHSLHWDDTIEFPTLRSLAAQRPTTADGMFDAMIDLYRALPRRMHVRIQGLIRCIATGRLPLVVHCAAGKDRTGFAIAVLLSMLGVPRDTVIGDYLLTNQAGDFEQFIRGRHQAQLGLAENNHPLLAMSPEVRRVVFSAHADFLGIALEQVDTELGGLDTYLEHTVGVDAETRERVLSALLTR